MIGFAPGLYWRFCWRFAAPLFLMFIIVYGLLGYEPLSYENYVYPNWANILGWVIAGSSVIMIPAVALYKFIVTPGSCLQVPHKALNLRKNVTGFVLAIKNFNDAVEGFAVYFAS